MITPDSPMATAHDDSADLSLVKEILRSNERAAKSASETTAKAIAALTAEVVGLRADITRLALSPRLVLIALGTVVSAALVTTLAIGYLVIHLTTLIAAHNGVDVNAAANATSTVITSTADALHTAETDAGGPIPLDTDGDN